ncbi:MAG TPA: hypothetical protein VMS88_06095, partial [Terriglobales bacterium]|nr:hypothetical protein [Terriglobales bacterium]
MKRIAVAVLMVCLALLVAGVANADPRDCASSHVFVNVDPNISLCPDAAAVDLGSVQQGPFGSGIIFKVDANTEQVKFSAGVSKLYKGDVTSQIIVDPIAICYQAGVCMRAEMANPIGGHPNKAEYVDGEVSIKDGYFGKKTEWVTFESGQNNHFSQLITL